MKTFSLSTCISLLITNLFFIISEAQQTFATIEPAQSTLDRINPRPVNKFPNEVSVMADSYNLDVNEYNGRLNLVLPLLDLRVPSIPCNVSLNYIAGVKVNELASCVGAGWSLIYGASISREIRGGSDFGYSDFVAGCIGSSDVGSFGYLDEPRRVIQSINPTDCNIQFSTIAFPHQPMSINDENFLEAKATCGISERFDTEPDIFTLTLPNFTTRFIFLTRDQILFETDRQIKVLHAPVHDDDGWRIQIDDGTIYTFGGVLDGCADRERIHPNPAFQTPRLDYTSAWHVKRIESIKGDIIDFEYNSYLYDRSVFADVNNGYIHSVEGGFAEGIFSLQVDPDFTWQLSTTSSTDYFRYNVVYPRLISYSNSKVRREMSFLYNLNRLDKPDLPVLGEINCVTIEEQSNTVCFGQTIVFITEKALNRLWLKGFKINAVDQSGSILSLPEYSFEYYSIDEFPPYSSRSIDYWGYYNAKSNSNLIPKTNIFGNPSFIVPQWEIYGAGPDEVFYAQNETSDLLIGLADRSVNISEVSKGSLKKLITPMGLEISFEYESNDFQIEGQLLYGGGIRVRKVTKGDPNGISSEEYYLYRTNPFDTELDCDRSSGKLMYVPEFSFISPVQTASVTSEQLNSANFCGALSLTSRDIWGLSTSAGGGHVGYDRIFKTSSLDGSTGFETWAFHNDGDQHPDVTWSGANFFPLYTANNASVSCRPFHKVPLSTSKSMNGKIREYKVYKKDNANFVLELKETMRYTQSAVKMWDGSLLLAIYGGPNLKPDLLATAYPQFFDLCELYMNGYYRSQFAVSQLVEKTSFAYGEGSGTQKIAYTISEEYEYWRGLLSKRKVKGPEGNVQMEELIYLDQLDPSLSYHTTPRSELVASNINVLSRKKLFINSILVNDQIYSHDRFGNVTADFIFNEEQSDASGYQNVPTGFECRVTYEYDDHHNLINKINSAGIGTSFHYRNDLHLSSQTVGASYRETCFIDFESTDCLPYVGAQNQGRVMGGAKSGNYSYRIDATTNPQGFQFTSGISPTKRYRISLWIKTDSETGYVPNSVVCFWNVFGSEGPVISPFSDGELTISDTDGQWKKIEFVLDGLQLSQYVGTLQGLTFQFFLALNSNVGRIELDDFRFYPDDSHSLITVTDIDGKVLAKMDNADYYQHFEYDALGRISVERNNEGQVIKVNQYNYGND